MIDFDRYVLGPCMATFGRTVTYYGDGAPIDLLAVFDDRYRETTFQGFVSEVVTTRPVLGFRASSLPAGSPVQGHLFRVDGRFYAVVSPPEPDGQGHVKVPLRFATDEEATRILPP